MHHVTRTVANVTHVTRMNKLSQGDEDVVRRGKWLHRTGDLGASLGVIAKKPFDGAGDEEPMRGQLARFAPSTRWMAGRKAMRGAENGMFSSCLKQLRRPR